MSATTWRPEFCGKEIADHAARIVILEEERRMTRDDLKDLANKLDKLQYWIMGTLAAALASIGAHFMAR